MIIRSATPADIDAMLALGAAVHAESNFRDYGFDADLLRHDAGIMFAHPEMYFMAVVEDGDGIFGMYLGFLCRAFFSRDHVAYDMLLYVTPSRRGGTAAARLIKAFEQWAWAAGAIDIRPGVTSGINPERTCLLYMALGYQQIGYILRKEHTHGRTLTSPDSTHPAVTPTSGSPAGADG